MCVEVRLFIFLILFYVFVLVRRAGQKKEEEAVGASEQSSKKEIILHIFYLDICLNFGELCAFGAGDPQALPSEG